jgi:hypothetical protein
MTIYRELFTGVTKTSNTLNPYRMSRGHIECSVLHARNKEMTMSGSRLEETNENTDELPMRALLEEEFRAVFGGTLPVTAAWAGLTFI